MILKLILLRLLLGSYAYDMAELTPAEAYSPRSQPVWRSLLCWLAFLFQIFFQIIRALAHYPLLSLSSSSSSSPSFKPLPSLELQEHHLDSAVDISANDSSSAADSQPLQRLTVCLAVYFVARLFGFRMACGYLKFKFMCCAFCFCFFVRCLGYGSWLWCGCVSIWRNWVWF